MNIERSDIWLVVVVAIIALIVYGIASSKLKSRKQRIAREKTVPLVPDTITVGKRYTIALSDGKRYADIEIVGTTDPHTGDGFFGGWGAMLVLRQSNGKRLFLRQSSVRSAEEQ